MRASLVHAMCSLGALSGVAVCHDQERRIFGPTCCCANPLERYLDADLDVVLEEFFAV
ncbi:hypothetical protein P5P86_14590 [Nocardioides sp. BP30]|uniref:hypothetical protein n=1 Tax=Nocardioides sp. BP30 TaxID=3036374 RepID=UPI00246876BD|nr:hypothetical protein [Nocardioides sp. BP30]WGL51187.1 hypothetical protein P5P86_14590 [Nocardioides sp. BP30]